MSTVFFLISSFTGNLDGYVLSKCSNSFSFYHFYVPETRMQLVLKFKRNQHFEIAHVCGGYKMETYHNYEVTYGKMCHP